jgi:hypothetical protein
MDWLRPLKLSLALGLASGGVVGCTESAPATGGAPAAPTGLAAERGRLFNSDDFRAGLAQWAVEQQPGGTVASGGGRLLIADKGGCTVWFRPRIEGPVIISYEATVSSQARVSDLNCFWMATDPQQPREPFTAGSGRHGRFAEYDTLQTYYVGYGGNNNTTTRFRRYDGSGARPLLPEHDLTDRRFLLVPDHPYRITLVAAVGRVQFIRDGEVIFDYRDPQPLTSGWFGFRTIDSRIEIRHFQVWEARPVTPSN